MASHSRLEVWTAIVDSGLVPLFYHAEVEIARRILRACAQAGVRCVEFTNRGDQAHLVFQDLVRRSGEERSLILGAGSVLDPGTAALYIQLGAEFIVGPAFNPEVARICNRRKVAYLPGCATASEISAAEELGAEICKIFPGGQVGGPEFIKAILGPMPWARLMPTGGVEATQESVNAWIKAGAACLGIGSNLVTKQSVAAGEFDAIGERAGHILGWIRAARGV
jgi:2-dehydro-3-deoxyphosphogluconate aldolase / (4S)-4-hydroxy-2-oxoglutarate aldolase